MSVRTADFLMRCLIAHTSLSHISAAEFVIDGFVTRCTQRTCFLTQFASSISKSLYVSIYYFNPTNPSINLSSALSISVSPFMHMDAGSLAGNPGIRS